MFWQGKWTQLIHLSRADVSSDGKNSIPRRVYEQQQLQDRDGHRVIQQNELKKAARMVDGGALGKAMEILEAITVAPTTWHTWALLQSGRPREQMRELEPYDIESAMRGGEWSDIDSCVFIHGITHAQKEKGVGPSGLASEHL